MDEIPDAEGGEVSGRAIVGGLNTDMEDSYGPPVGPPVAQMQFRAGHREFE